MAQQLVAGDTLSTLRVPMVEASSGQPLNLTGATVSLRWKIDAGALVTRTPTILDPATQGVVEYQFTTGELVAGQMLAEVTATLASGKQITTQELITLTIRARLS